MAIKKVGTYLVESHNRTISAKGRYDSYYGTYSSPLRAYFIYKSIQKVSDIKRILKR